MKYQEKDKVRMKKDCFHKELSGKVVTIDYIDEGHNRMAYFIKDGQHSWFEVYDEDIKELNTTKDNKQN